MSVIIFVNKASHLCDNGNNPRHILTQFSSVSALDRPGGLRALAEMLLVPAGRDVWLGAAGALKTAKITSLSNE